MSSHGLSIGLQNMMGAFNPKSQAMGPLAMLGVSAGQSAIQGISNMFTAKGDRRHQLDMWKRNNAYNHPSEQMARLRKAGLNPNLMYGQGTVGNSPSPPKSTPTRPTEFNALGALMQTQQTKMMEVQTDNLRAQNDLLQNDKLIKVMEAMLKGNELKRDNIDTSSYQQMSDIAVLKAEDEQRMKSIQASMSQNEYEVFKRNQTLFNQALIDSQRIKSQNMTNAEKTGELRQLELDMKNSVKEFQNSNQIIDLISKFFSVISKFK